MEGLGCFARRVGHCHTAGPACSFASRLPQAQRGPPSPSQPGRGEVLYPGEQTYTNKTEADFLEPSRWVILKAIIASTLCPHWHVSSSLSKQTERLIKAVPHFGVKRFSLPVTPQPDVISSKSPKQNQNKQTKQTKTTTTKPSYFSEQWLRDVTWKEGSELPCRWTQ